MLEATRFAAARLLLWSSTDSDRLSPLSSNNFLSHGQDISFVHLLHHRSRSIIFNDDYTGNAC